MRRGAVMPLSSRSRSTATRQVRAGLTVRATVRLAPSVLARVDAVAKARSTKWHKVTRAEILREIIHLGLDVYEKRRTKPAQTKDSDKPR